MDQINAPYNFIPLSDDVVTPRWGYQVSQDLPFKDGLSGELILDIHTHSAIMVGGKQTIADDDNAGKVEFFENKDGKYTIPGSSLRGVIRSVMEVATFSRMNLVDDKSYGLRDITGKYVKEAYTDKVKDKKLQYGFLQLNDEGKPAITPCSMARLSHRDLEKWWKEKAPIFTSGTTVKEKYENWEDFCKKHKVTNSMEFNFKGESEVEQIGEGKLTGFPVFTGQISDITHDKGNKKGKYKDFVFYNSRENDRFVLDDADPRAWRDFLFIHHDEDGKKNQPWVGHWKEEFWKKNKVPVFYLKSSNRLQIGLAYMPKLAGDFSIHDMIKHTSEKHFETNKLDFTSLVFGQTGDEPKDALKGRVYFEPAILQGDQQAETEPETTILNGAKPSYFPNYIKQDVDENGKLKKGKQYTTYIRSSSSITKPELRGWKRYPVRKNPEVKIQKLQKNQEDNTKVQTKLHTLPKGCHFKGRLVFHNLKPEELGALLWSIHMEGSRHSIGMGKSFGYGQVDMTVEQDSIKITPNHPDAIVKSQDDYTQQFQAYMKEELSRDWGKTNQIKTLKALTSIEDRDIFKGKLEHMKMEVRGTNEFVVAKQEGLALATYIKETNGDCEWVDETIKALAIKNRVPDNKLDDVLKGNALANEWEKIEDEELKSDAFMEIKRRWKIKGWWEMKLTGAAKKAKVIYDQGS